jgi:hypothetical protein
VNAKPTSRPAGLPADAAFVELRPDWLTFETQQRLLPGTRVRLRLLMEGRPLLLELPADTCQFVSQPRGPNRYHVRLSFRELSEADRKIVALFITKGRGSPQIAPADAGS